MSPLGSRRAGAGGAGSARNVGSSLARIHASPIGVRTGVSSAREGRRTPARPLASPIPAHCANASAVVGPKTCRYRRASSRRASRGSTSGGGTVQIVGCRAPSQRIRTRAGRRRVAQPLPVHAEPAPASPYGIRRPSRNGVSGRRCPRRPPARPGSVGSRPSVNGAVLRRDDVRAEPRTPQLDERRVLPGRRLGALDARMDRQQRGARHAVRQARPRRRRSESGPGGSRSSRAPARRRKARIWARSRSSGGVTPRAAAGSRGRPSTGRPFVVAAGERRVDLRDVVEIVDGPRREQLAHRDLAELRVAADAVELVVADELAKVRRGCRRGAARTGRSARGAARRGRARHGRTGRTARRAGRCRARG